MVTPESLGTQAVSNVISVSSGGQSKRNGGQVPADLAVLLPYLDEPRRHPTSSNDQE
jgi:hypothetical protein